jgi:hypothetical protein
MRIWRRAAVAAAWALATGLGAALVWVGLRPVLHAAVPDRAAPLSVADVRNMATPATVPPLSAGPPSLPPSSPAARRTAAPSRQPSAPGRGSPAPVASSPAVVDGWTVTTRPDGTVSYVRSFHVTGGDAVIGMTPGHVYLISATPRADYTVQTEQPAQTRLVVRFISGGQADLIDAIWWNDAPYAQVS